MRNIFLIDFENVGSDGLSGILNLTAEDRVIIFYSTKSNRLTMRAHILIGRAEAKFTYYEATVGGKNALDHQLSTYLGYLIGTNAADQYYIVSRDNGYRYASNFWNDMLKQNAVVCIDNIKSAQKITEKMLRKAQEEATSRTGEDLHDDDLAEGTGEPMEEPAGQNAVEPAVPAAAPAVSAPAAEEPDPAAAEPAPSAVPEPAPAVPAAEEPASEPESAAEPVQDLSPAVPAAAPAAAASISASAAAGGIALAPVPVQTVPALPAPGESVTVTAILLPENEIDDVVDPNRPRSNLRRQNRANNNRHNNRKPNQAKPDKKPSNGNGGSVNAAGGNGNHTGSAQKDDAKAAGAADNKPAQNEKAASRDNKPAQNEKAASRDNKPAQNEKAASHDNKPAQNEKAASRDNKPAQNEKAASHDNKPAQNEKAASRDNKPAQNEKAASHDNKPAQNEKAASRDNKPAQNEKAASHDNKPAQTERADGGDDWLTALLTPYPKLSAEKIREMIAGRKKQILCNSLRKQLGQEKGLALYSEIKKVAWK